MTISLAITAYEESRKPGKLERAMDSAKDSRVDELLIYDDGSADWRDTQRRVQAWPRSLGLEVRFVHGERNYGVFGAKLAAIRHAKGEWVQSLDSDNFLPQAYWDVLGAQERIPRRMLSPSFARPNFDYRALSGMRWNRDSLPALVGFRVFGCVANTGNQFFHRPMMLNVMERWREYHNEQLQPDYFGRVAEYGAPSLKWRNVYDSADSFFFNKCWVAAGHEILIVPDLHYDHEVHQHSSWQAAPQEKEALPSAYYLELNDLRNGQAFEYRLDAMRHLNKRYCAVWYRKRTGHNPDCRIWVAVDTFEIMKTEPV